MTKQAEKVGTEKLVRVDVMFSDVGDVKLNVAQAVIEGYTEKNIKLGENDDDLKRFVNRDLVGELLTFDEKGYSKWIVVDNETDFKNEVRRMILEIGKLVRNDESGYVNYFTELKRNLREVGKKYLVEPEKNPGERRGRPKGSKNKPKDDLNGESEANKNLSGETVVERRGRPKGSKNKTKNSENVTVTTEGDSVVKRRGRPKGSKNKSKDEVPFVGVQSGADVFESKESMKGKGGRPKGSKNRTKVASDDIPFVAGVESV